MRKLCFVLLVLALCGLLMAPGAAAAQPPVRVLVNGEPVAAPALLENDRVLVPAAPFFSSLGLGFRWFPTSGRLLAAGGAHRLWLKVGAPDATLHMNVPPRLVSGQVCVPVRAVAETLGGTVTWDAVTRTVFVVLPPVTPTSAGRFEPVILVHGLNGDKHSWESATGPSLYDHLVTDLGFTEGRDLFRLEWDSTSAEATFAGAAPKLGEAIDRVLGDYLAAGYPDAKVTLIGHSAGGVLIRYWAAADPDYRDKVATLVTVGSPHQGAAGAAGYGAANGWPLAQQMEPAVQAEFNRDHPAGWLPGVNLVLVAHLNDELVEPRSALGYPETVGLLDALLQEASGAETNGYAVRRQQSVTLMLGHGQPDGVPAGDIHFGLIRNNWGDWFSPIASSVVRGLTH